MNFPIEIGRVLVVAVLTVGYAGVAGAQNPGGQQEEKKATAAQEISKYPDPQEVAESAKKAAAYFRRNLSVGGGYAWSWSKDLRETHGENRTTSALIMIQPPGTPAVGIAMLDGYLTLDDPLMAAAAREAGGGAFVVSVCDRWLGI